MALAGKGVAEIYEALSLGDVQSAADEFRPLYDKTDGKDGYVSLEVNPHLAHDTTGTIEEARRLWTALNRPNVFIKVPATAEGLPAIRQLISEGISVNVTLLFGLPRYRQVADAYIAGIEARAAQGKPVKHVASVASFFVSRIDALVDPLLEKQHRARRPGGRRRETSAWASRRRQREDGLSDLQGNLRQRSVQEPCRQGCSSAAAALGQHGHQESGLQRREIRRIAHRAGHGQHGPGRNPRCLPRPRRSAGPLGARCPAGRLGFGAIAGTRHRHRQGDAAA